MPSHVGMRGRPNQLAYWTMATSSPIQVPSVHASSVAQRPSNGSASLESSDEPADCGCGRDGPAGVLGRRDGGMARWIDAPDLVSVARTGAASASMTVRRWPDPKTSPGTVPPPRLRRRCACIGGPQAAITSMRVRGRQGSQVRSTRVRSRSPRERKSSKYSRSSSQGDGNPPSPCSAPTRAPVIAATVSAS